MTGRGAVGSGWKEGGGVGRGPVEGRGTRGGAVTGGAAVRGLGTVGPMRSFASSCLRINTLQQ